MCGRMVLTRSAHEIAEMFDLPGPQADCELGPRYNVAPSQDVLAIRILGDGNAQLDPLHWGLIPSWSKARSTGYRMINARCESAAEKPSFRGALRARRCIVPADGFYEWQSPPAAVGKGKVTKIPHYFRPPDGDLLAMAGLWESWTDRTTGEVVESCSLLTCDANSDMRPVHHRMPILLARADHAAWLDPLGQDVESLRPLLAPARAGTLEAIAVSTRVNNPRNEDARCIEPAPGATTPA